MMIARATTTTEGKESELLILGLSKINVGRLLAGKPIHIRKAVHGDGVPEGWEIMICFGNTEEDILAELRPFAGPDAKVIQTDKLGRDSNS
jgi:hypothetical protein